ncbi:DUF2911 domain-containing protein [Sphingobacterium griseoflavum]|uniref:DUF2911 domain-containing protein n=1 Tax=Sphingobacterium griseoflavum TaxID=1474952 RepID=A0ABQ3HWF7_9SPHI|nr:DUF2911 domain-containing protein [Sphingobacterium griseoflavum]GHE41282.1 hypothetical protein GCM10017764_25760 [Sphingobacterium griseoflavum]
MKAAPILFFLMMISFVGFAQNDKSKRPSPPDSVNITTQDGVNISIHYSKPSLKGRQLGVDIAPIGKIWRTGANEATTIAFDKDVTIEGKPLSAGKYSLYTIPGQQQTTLIFNKVWDQWGTKYDESQDALRVNVSNATASASQEQFTITAAPSGSIRLAWGEHAIPFQIKATK